VVDNTAVYGEDNKEDNKEDDMVDGKEENKEDNDDHTKVNNEIDCIRVAVQGK
jgi:hypothetical protein